MADSNTLSVVGLKTRLDDLTENVDEIYLITNGIFVVLMQCGFACLEAGCIRSKNVTNILMKNVLDLFISGLAFWLIGYAIAYGEGNPFMGVKFWAGIGIPGNKFAFWFFQFVFAATAATILSGAVAERCSFKAYITYSALISGIIYPVVVHWVWSPNGWLTNLGYSDFAGSGPVHLLGGTCSLVGAAILGPRIGRFDGKEMPGHSTALIGIGGLILITGFLAFNGGSLGTMTTPQAGQTISKVTINTVMGGTGSCLTALLAAKVGLVGPKVWNFSLTLNAALAGMVAVCGAANELIFWSSFVLGVISAPVFIGFHYLIPICKVDDPLDAVAVHLGGGMWGIIGGPIFKTNGIIYGPNGENLMGLLYNFIGVLSIFLWSFVTSAIMFGVLKALNSLRVSEEAEIEGLDIAKHDEPAYPAIAWNECGDECTLATIRYEINGAEKNKKQTPARDYTNQAFHIDSNM